MQTAAVAWDKLSAEMRFAAAAYGSVISELTGEGWQGPASTSMAASAARYLDWLDTTAAQAEQVGSQAKAAATAYEAAFAMTVPPAVIAANRAQLVSLVNTNVLGQNTPAIAATEAQYAAMWAQDATAMYGYAGASSNAAKLAPFAAPQSATSSNAASQQATAVSQAANTAAASQAATSATNPLGDLIGSLGGTNNSALGTFMSGNLFSTALVNGAIAGGPFNPQFILQTIAGLKLVGAAQQAELLPGVGAVVGPWSAALTSAAVPSPSGLPVLASAGIGQAGQVGALSVPQGWAASGATVNAAGSGLPVTSIGDPMATAGAPVGVTSPTTGAAGGRRRLIPKYGFRLPAVMARPFAAG